MRVLVTRPVEAARDTAAALAEFGHEAVMAPLLEIVRTQEAAPVGCFDGIIVTSRHALPALREISERVASVPIFGVGRRTARAIEDSGIGPVTVAGPDAAALASFVAHRLPPGARLLHICGRDRKAEPAATLASAGLLLASWETYAAQAVDDLPESAASALAAGTLDAAFHYSARSAAVAARLAAQAGLAAPFAALLHIALSTDVAEVLQPFAVEVAAESTQDAMLAALSRSAGRSRAGHDPDAKDGTNLLPGLCRTALERRR